MKIILNQDVPNLGEEGDVVVVKDGYARNYLLPHNYAVVYNKSNVAIFASRADAIEKRKEEKRKESATLGERLKDVVITIVMSAGDTGKLFGSVTNTMISEELSKMDIYIDRKKIEVASHTIKMTGTYSVRIHLYENNYAIVKLVVKSEAQVKAEAKAAKEAEAKAKKEAELKAKKEAEEKAKAEEKAEVAEAEAEKEADTDQ